MAVTTDSLRNILLDEEKWHQPWTSGVIELSDPLANLYFTQKDGTPRRVDLKSTTDADGEALANACSSATFGRGKEDVLDENYRKAGKLEPGNFAWLFSSDTGDIVSRLVRGLFPWGTLKNGIRLEMYKLNVYRTGSFFKAHKDTPRSEDMFGSLVIVLPFAHEGGNLVLRHNDKTFDFYAPSLLRDAAPGSIAYTAFYSDVEHEVLEVTSGNRVTVTFNLYFDKTSIPRHIIPPSSPDHPFKVALEACLRHASFRRDHPYLGFGLQHSYPVGTAENSYIARRLKGFDNVVYHALNDLGLKPQFKYLYHSHSGFGVVLDRPIKDDGFTEEGQLVHLMEHAGAAIAWYGPVTTGGRYNNWMAYYQENESEWDDRIIPITWITKPTDNLTGKNSIIVYGNEPSISFCYYRVCMLVMLE